MSAIQKRPVLIVRMLSFAFCVKQEREDSAAQAYCDMRLVTIMKRAELTQKMIEMKMSMWEKTIDGAAKERIYESIQGLFDKAEDLQTQLQDVGSEERVCNPIVLRVLSTVATSMGLNFGKTSSGKTSGGVASDCNN